MQGPRGDEGEPGTPGRDGDPVSDMNSLVFVHASVCGPWVSRCGCICVVFVY